MTLLDKISAETRNVINTLFDKEPLNYLEATSMYAIIAQGRHNAALLEILYNHAHDPDLKRLIKEAIDAQISLLISQAEDFLEESRGGIPNLRFPKRQLHAEPLAIPESARFTDMEIAITIGAMAKASQLAILTAMHNSYQLNVLAMYRKLLDAGLDWDYRLLELMLNRGWLPEIGKITH